MYGKTWQGIAGIEACLHESHESHVETLLVCTSWPTLVALSDPLLLHMLCFLAQRSTSTLWPRALFGSVPHVPESSTADVRVVPDKLRAYRLRSSLYRLSMATGSAPSL